MSEKFAVAFDVDSLDLGHILKALSNAGLDLSHLRIADPFGVSIGHSQPPHPAPRKLKKVAKTIQVAAEEKEAPAEKRVRGRGSRIRFNLGQITPLDIPGGGAFLRNGRYCNLEALEKAKTLEEAFTNSVGEPSNCIIFPAGPDGVRNTFFKKHQWGNVSVNQERLQKEGVKHLALYETSVDAFTGEAGGRRAVVGHAPITKMQAVT